MKKNENFVHKYKELSKIFDFFFNIFEFFGYFLKIEKN